VTVSVYYTEHYPDGSSEMALQDAWSYQVRSIKDLIQFDYKDVKILNKAIKKDVRLDIK
jgi:hypothetical protein